MKEYDTDTSLQAESLWVKEQDPAGPGRRLIAMTWVRRVPRSNPSAL